MIIAPLSFSDIRRIFRRFKRELLTVALCATAVAFFFLLTKEPLYLADATFKQSSGKVEQSVDLKNLLRTMVNQDAESGAISTLMSAKLLKKAVETLGLQASVQHERPLLKKLKTIFKNIRLELSTSISDGDSFEFENVVYGGESTANYFIRFYKPDEFDIYDKDGHHIRAAKVRDRLELGDISLTLKKRAENINLWEKYSLSVSPWRNIVSEIRDHFTIKPLPTNKSILVLKFEAADRHLAARFVNQTMISFQDLLKEENEAVAREQMAYLEKRQDELTLKLDETLQAYVAMLKGSMGARGFLSSEQENELFIQPQEDYLTQLFSIETELARLEAATLTQHERGIKGQYRLIKEKQREKISTQMEEANHLLTHVDTFSIPSIKSHFSSAFMALKKANESQNEEGAAAAKSTLKAHIQNWLSSLQTKKTLLEEQDLASAYTSDFQGIDTGTARKLYAHYSEQLDTLQTSLVELVFFRDQIDKPGFDLSPLSSVLTDSVTQDLVKKASDLELSLHDELHRMGREQERTKEALDLQKKFISSYIQQTVDLNELKINLAKEKIALLQTRLIDHLKHEKALVEGQIQQISKRMEGLPEKWHLETLLKMKTEMTKAMIEGMTQYVESKNLNRNLFHVESKPIDLAFPPLSAQKPRLILISLLIGLLVTFLFFLYRFGQLLIKGIPASLDTVKFLGLPVAGSLRSVDKTDLNEIEESDLETYRQMTRFIMNGQKVTVLFGAHRNSSFLLASLLKMHSLKTLVIDCNFHPILSKDDVPGLLHHLQGAPLAVRHFDGYDFIPSGGSHRHSVELFTSDKFKQLVEESRTLYDRIILLSNAPLSSVEAPTLLVIADGMISFVGRDSPESILEITRQNEKCSAIFAAYEN